MKKIYNKKSKEDKEKEVNELFKKANEGIENCFSSIEQLKELADYMSKFYNYSLRNTFLIQEQFEGAFAVGSYSFWKDKGFSVNKGEKGIKILVPNKLSDYFINLKGEETKLSKATPEEKRLIEEGKIELKKGKIIFNQGYVFDVSQTNAKAEDLPKIFPGRWLDGEVKNYDLMYKAMENIAKKIGVKIIEPKSELGAAKGAAYPLTKEVALNPRNTELQNVKTLIHELAHAKLHTIEKIDNYTTNEREFQAEMTAYVVSSYFGLDTSEYSFRYISSWSKDTELKEKEKLINEVKETVKEYVEIIENTLINDKELSLSLDNENRVKENENMKIGLTQKEVNKMVKDHEEWINTKGKKGKRLDLEGKELNGIRLLNVNLKEANLKNMTIKDSTIFANLDGADFEGTKIENSKFIGSKIENLKIDAKELERINIQIKEELSLHNEAESTLKTNKNKRKTKEKNNENEIQI